MRISTLFSRWRSMRWPALALTPLLAPALLLVLACEGDSLKPPPPAQSRDLYWDLELNHRAVTLSMAAPYNTLTLMAVPRNYLGEPLAGFPMPTFTSADRERVEVTADGMLLAVAPTTQPVLVRATLTTDNLKNQDSLYVRVVPDTARRALMSLSIHPVPPDSAKISFSSYNESGLGRTLPVRAVDSSGAPLSNLLVGFRSSDTTILKLLGNSTLGTIKGRRYGAATIFASATAFGVTKADTLPYRVGWPTSARVNLGDPAAKQVLGSFIPQQLTVGTGAVVSWWGPGFVCALFCTDPFIDTVDVTFDETDVPKIAALGPAQRTEIDLFTLLLCGSRGNCAGTGNFVLGGPPVVSTSFAIRVFTMPGTYQYRSTRRGTIGRIVVVDER